MLILWLVAGGHICASRFDVNQTVTVPDSLLKEAKVYQLSVDQPKMSFSILGRMRELKMFPDWKLDLMTADCYTNQRQFRLAKTHYVLALENPDLEGQDMMRLSILKRLVGVCDRLFDDEDLTKYLYEMDKLAKSNHEDYYQALAQFIYGKRMFYENDSLAVSICQEAVSMVSNVDNERKDFALFFFYGDLTRMYRAIGRYDEALRLSFLQEKVDHQQESFQDMGIYFPSIHLIYAQRASLYAEMGRQEDADKAYQRWKKTKGVSPADEKDILGYLISSKHYDEAQQLINNYKKYLVEEGDSISFWMLHAVSQETIVLSLEGKMQEASELFDDLNEMATRLHRNGSQQVMKATYAMLEQQEKAHRRNMWLINGVVIIVSLIVILVIFVIHARKLKHRNQTLSNLLNGIEAYRYTAMKNEEASQSQPSVTPPKPAAEKVKTISEEEKKRVEEQLAERDKDKQIFVEMDKKITRNLLFLNPDLSRDDLMALTGLDKNRFGRMMSRYSLSNNVSSYISAKRVEYGAELLKKHPEYTISAIADMCGMSNTVTFNRSFKSYYGITPSEYRRNEMGNGHKAHSA